MITVLGERVRFWRREMKIHHSFVSTRNRSKDSFKNWCPFKIYEIRRSEVLLSTKRNLMQESQNVEYKEIWN